MHDVHVHDWSELNRELYESSWNPILQRFRSDFVYRGLGVGDWGLTTSLMRLGGNFRELESHLLRNFRKYATKARLRDESEWTWLAMAQHHGLPTRMLDWTYSPYVALHFATADELLYDSDGIVWCVNYVKLHEKLPAKLKRVLRQERSNAFTSQMLQRAADSLTSLERLARKEFVLFYEPPSLDDRIVNQFSIFSMMSSPEAQFGEFIERAGKDVVRRIVIPAKLKWEIRDKLDQANITERVLFPGLDGLCEWLKRHYTPRFAEKETSKRVPVSIKNVMKSSRTKRMA